MAEHPNVAVTRRFIDALNRGDIEAMTGFVADDVVWHYIGGTEPVHGRAAMAEGLSPSQGDYTITAELHDVVANDDHTVALVEATAVRGGKTFTYRAAEIMHLEDGKVTERWAFSDDTAAIVAFFA